MRRRNVHRIKDLAIRRQPAGEFITIPGPDTTLVIRQVTRRVIPYAAHTIWIANFVARRRDHGSVG